MGWIDKIKNSHGLRIFILMLLICIILLLSVIVMLLIFPFLSSKSSTVQVNGVADVIAIITVIVLAFGTLIYAGTAIALNERYRLMNMGFRSKELIIIYGALIFIGVAFSVVVSLSLYKQYLDIIEKIPLFIILLIILITLFIISLLLIEVGKLNAARILKNEKVTLKMIAYDESGKIQLVIKPDLKLYLTTDKDYWFKDSNEDELIVPVGQVQEIIYRRQ